MRLTEPYDFRKFKVLLKGAASVDSLKKTNIIVVDDGNALVPIALVPALPGRPTEGAWETAYADMVRKARDHGWIDDGANAIRAHIEREA
ncbi:hypothetical protein [Bradyrhizobium jicamae]|uniref:hypothetical protein n=1 Tax=Bradyrhizobium jicamae TaxID=280332 RepID=UPI0020129F3F|nr:hypothetical protein [Bradyrhizobium jicamae]